MKLLPRRKLWLHPAKTKTDNHKKLMFCSYDFFTSLNTILKLPDLLEIDLIFSTDFLVNKLVWLDTRRN